MNGLDKIGFQYNYDQLNRLKTSTAINGLDTANNLWNVNLLSDYYTTLNYDANGNILEMLRRGTIQNNQLLEMDMLTYNYKPGTNQLTSVNDAVASNNYSVDIDDQQANNYVYTAIGELTKDESEGIASIEWDVYGKVKKLKRSASDPRPQLEFSYDGMGNRVSKKVILKKDLPETTYYVRDAQGNILSTYKLNPMVFEFELEEQMIYGSQRLGVIKRNKIFIADQGGLIPELKRGTIIGIPKGIGGLPVLSSSIPGTRTAVITGNKRYELDNWLGNVHVVISDRKLQVDTNSDGMVDYYRADIRSAVDMFPGGMIMPGRSYNPTEYRFGYNGQEKVDELKGTGKHCTAEFWEYDPRVGPNGRWNIDPEFRQYPGWSPYVTFFDNPIWFSDPLGNAPENPDWVEKKDGNIKWDENVTSANDKDLHAGDKYFSHRRFRAARSCRN